MPYQNISASLSDGDKSHILDYIKQIEILLPFLVNLTIDERVALYKMGNKSVS